MAAHDLEPQTYAPSEPATETRARWYDPHRSQRFHLLFICLLAIGAGNSMLTALLPPLVRRLALPDSSIGWIFSLSALLWVFSSPYWGRLSNRAGRKPIIAAGLFAYAVSTGLFALAVIAGLNGLMSGVALFAALVLTRAIFGAFGSAASPAAQAYIADRTTLIERTAQLAALSAAFAVGQVLGPAFCAALAVQVGMVAPLVIVSVLAVIGAFAIWRFLPETQRPTAPTTERENLWDSLALARDNRIAGFLIFGFALSVVTGTLQQIFALYVMDTLHVAGRKGAELAALGFMVNAMALIVTQLAILPRLRLAPRSLMAWGTALVGAGIAAQIVAPSLGALLVSQVIQGVGFGLARPGFTGGASISVRADEQGASAGLVVAINGAGFIFSPLTGAVAYQYYGSHAPLWIALALIMFMLIFALRSRRLRRSVLEPSSVLSEP